MLRIESITAYYKILEVTIIDNNIYDNIYVYTDICIYEYIIYIYI